MTNLFKFYVFLRNFFFIIFINSYNNYLSINYVYYYSPFFLYLRANFVKNFDLVTRGIFIGWMSEKSSYIFIKIILLILYYPLHLLIFPLWLLNYIFWNYLPYQSHFLSYFVYRCSKFHYSLNKCKPLVIFIFKKNILFYFSYIFSKYLTSFFRIIKFLLFKIKWFNFYTLNTVNYLFNLKVFTYYHKSFLFYYRTLVDLVFFYYIFSNFLLINITFLTIITLFFLTNFIICTNYIFSYFNSLCFKFYIWEIFSFSKSKVDW